MDQTFTRFFKKFTLILFLLAAGGVTVRAQTISGMVMNANQRLSGANIQDLRTRGRVISDVRGVFTVCAEKGDTLITSFLNYKTDTVIFTNQNFILIRLTENSRMLKEVTIRDSVLSPQEVYKKNQLEYKDIYVKGDKSKIFAVQVGLTPGVAINIDKVYNALSKEGKDARKMQRTLTADYKGSVVDKRFSKTLVTKITGYNGKKLDDFMLNNRPTYEFAVNATDYKMIQYIKQKAGII